MKHTLLLAAGLLAIAGCNDPAPPTTTQITDVGTPGAATETAVSSINCPEPVRYNPFPAGIEPSLAYHLRSDRLSTAKNGQMRRRVTVEFLEGDTEAALLAFEKAIVAGGYKIMPRKAVVDGRTSTAFTKAGFGKAIMRTVPEPGRKPSHPEAKGILSIDYPVATPAPAGSNER